MNRFPTLTQSIKMAEDEAVQAEKEWYDVAATAYVCGQYFEDHIEFSSVSYAWEYFENTQLRPGMSISIWDKENLITQRGHTVEEEKEFCYYQKWQEDGGAEGFAWYQKEQFLRGGYIPNE